MPHSPRLPFLRRSDVGAPAPARLQRATLVYAGILLCVIAAAYANSFNGAFVFDDLPAIRDNASIRDWTAWGQIFFPPHYLTTSGRPVVNATLALSYALSGTNPWGYHAVNLIIHVSAALLLFGVIRRTLLLPRWQGRFAHDAAPLAFVSAALWALHPLQTQAVAYMIQRAESLMGLCYVLTLYCFLRSLDAVHPRRWTIAAIVACAVGMGSKEVMASAPLIVFLYDRTFIAGTMRAALRARRGLYSGLAATWIILALLIVGEGGNRGGSIGLGVAVGAWQHGVTQFTALTHYLALALWPAPLAFEYEPEWVQLADVAPQALLICALVAVTAFAVWRRSPLGVAGALFFAVLAPTSLMPAPTQLIAEHRMYLPLAAVVVVAVVGGYLWLGRRSVFLFSCASLGCALLTIERNVDYRTEIALWTDTIAKRPRNAAAHASLGNALARAGQLPAAIAECTTATQLDPSNAMYRYSLGLALAQSGRISEALNAYREAIRLRPTFVDARNDYAIALIHAGRRGDALKELTLAVQLAPDDAAAHYNLGALLTEANRAYEAIMHFDAALRLRPKYPEALVAYGTALASLGRVDDAMARYHQALALRPDDIRARNRAGMLLLALGRPSEAMVFFESALRLRPGDPATRANMAAAQTRMNGEN